MSIFGFECNNNLMWNVYLFFFDKYYNIFMFMFNFFLKVILYFSIDISIINFIMVIVVYCDYIFYVFFCVKDKCKMLERYKIVS